MQNQINMSKRLDIIDDVFTWDRSTYFFNKLIHYPFVYGERDSVRFAPTGMVHDLNANDIIYQEILEKTITCLPELKNLTPYRSYINFFIPGEFPNFHEDGQGLTILHYITELYNPYEGGETQFVNEDQTITGILPKPGRMTIFDGMITHRATSCKTLPRLTLAIKYAKSD